MKAPANASDPAPGRAGVFRRHRDRWTALLALAVSVSVAAWWWSNRLNSLERQLVGVWIVADSPVENVRQVVVLKRDRTMLTGQLVDGRISMLDPQVYRWEGRAGRAVVRNRDVVLDLYFHDPFNYLDYLRTWISARRIRGESLAEIDRVTDTEIQWRLLDSPLDPYTLKRADDPELVRVLEQTVSP